MVTSEEVESHAYWNKLLETCRPIQDFLELGEVISESRVMLDSVSEISKDTEEGNEFIDNPLNQYLVPSSLVERWGCAMGILISCLSSYYLSLVIIFISISVTPIPLEQSLDRF